MNKLSIMAALVLAANSTSVTTSAAALECYMWNSTTKEYTEGSYISALSDATSKADAAKTTYSYALDVSLTVASSSTNQMCD